MGPLERASSEAPGVALLAPPVGVTPEVSAATEGAPTPTSAARQEPASGRGAAWLLLAAALAGGAALRAYRIDGMSLWGDEACMLELARQPALQIVDVLASPDRPDVDVAPPLYFLLLRAFALLFGFDVMPARAFSALLSVATIGMVYGLGARFLDRTTGAIAAVLVASSAFHVWYAQEARMYALVTLLSVASTHAFLRYLRTGRGAPAYLLLAVAALYVQYYAYLLVAVQILSGAVYLATRRDRQGRMSRMVPLFWMSVVLLGCVLPWLPVVLLDLGHAREEGFPSNFSVGLSVPFVLAKMALFGNEAFLRDHAWLYVAAAPLFAFTLLRGILALPRGFSAAPFVLAAVLFLPMAIVVVATAAGAPVYKSHPFLLVAPFFSLLVAHGISRARGRRGTVLLAAMVLANLYVLHRLNFGDVYTKPKVREALAWVAARMQPGDLLLKVPGKIHGEPVETGELLSWRHYAPPELTLLELNGSREPELFVKLAAHVRGRSRLFLALAETQFNQELADALVAAASREIPLREKASFPSRMRDFGVSVLLFERTGTAGGPADPPRTSAPGEATPR